MTVPPPSGGSGPDLQQGEESLQEALGTLRTHLDTHEDAFFDTLERLLTAPLREAFSRAFRAHAELVDQSGLRHATVVGGEEERGKGSGESGGQREGEELSEGVRLRHYREGMRTGVLEPLLAEIAELDVGNTLTDRWSGFLDDLPTLAETLPEEIIRREPEDLYRGMEGDGRVRRARKAAIRGWRGSGDALATVGRGLLNLFSRDSHSPRTRRQHVRVREVARSCLLGHCPRGLVDLPEALQQHYALPIARVEAAVAQWTEDWFAAEDRAHVGGGHLGARFLELLRRDFPSSHDPEVGCGPDGPARSAAATGVAAAAGPGPEAPGELSAGTGDGETALAPTQELAEVWQILEGALTGGASLDAPTHVRDRVQKSMEDEWAVLQEEIRVSGSFQSRPSKGRAQRQVNRIVEREKARGESWGQWHIQALEHFRLTILLLRLRESWDKTKGGLMGGIVDQVLTPLLAAWSRARAGLQALQDEAEAHFSDPSLSENPAKLAEHIDDLLTRGNHLLGSELQGVLKEVDPVGSVHEIADRVANELAETLRFLPASLSIPPRQGNQDRVVPTSSPRDIPFREIVQQTVDVLSLEAVRNSPEPLLAYLEEAMARSGEIPTVVSFNLSEARDELRNPPEGTQESITQDARSLTVEGLARTAQGVEALAESLAQVWREFTQTTHELLEGSFREVHARAVAEGTVQEQMLDIRSRARSWFRAGWGWSRGFGQRVNIRLLKYGRLIKARFQKLVPLVRKVVGSPVTQEGEAERALVILRGIPRLLNSLPLVYRRLFSFESLADSTLMVGREAELKWVRGRLEAWKAGFGAPCVHTGPLGIGHTSFLNAMSAELLDGVEVFRVDLDARIECEEALASQLAMNLGVPGEGPWSLARIQEHLSLPSAGGKPVAILVEHLEHLFLRTPGGTDLLAQFLSFQASTSRWAFWVSTIPSVTWKLVQKSDPTAAGLAASQALTPFSRPVLEELIMARHRRSGLPVEFRQPGDLNPLVRRKLRRSRGEKAKQEVLRAEFFDRLFRMSSGASGTAILLWLRALDFSSRKGWLRVTPPRPIRFGFIEELDPEVDFVLKAFMEHGSLTLHEYASVFDVPLHEAYHTFEALRRRMLVEPLGTRRSAPPEPETVQAGVRYRIPGILSQVVANRLKNRNILH